MSLIPLKRNKQEWDHDMNCISYAMGVDDSINELSSQEFEIVPDDEDYKVRFNSVNSDIWESYIRKHIKDTYWNEYINLNTMDITFLIKENDEITRVVNHNFEEDDNLLQTCNRLSEQDFKTIKDLIYSCSFYKEAIENNPFKLKFDNPNIYMRPATENDVDNMYSWEMESIDKSLQEDPKVQQLIRDDCYQSIKDTQMIMDQDKTIGMFTACMIDNGEWRYIGEIYLIPEYRGQHIGSTILKNEIANYDRIRLQVAYDNENALRLYKSLGFKIVKENKEAKLYIMEYNKSTTVQEAVLKAKDKEKLKDSAYGIPELRKYPLTNKNGDYDENHIRMAVKFFGSAPKKYKKELAKRILRAAHSIDLDTEKWDTINKALKNHKESVVQEGFVDKNMKYTLAGIKIPKLGPVDEKYLMDHKSEYARLKKSGYIDLHDNNFENLFNDKADELYNALDNLFQHIGYAKDFNIYNKYRLLLCKLFDLPTNHVIGLEGFYPGNLGQLRLKEEEDSSGTPLKPDDVLYHTSSHKGITELQPSFVSRKTKTIRRMPGQNLLSIEALYTTPRVYVGLNTPVSRLGGHGSAIISDGTRIYKIIGFKGSVKEDKELHGAARFIETRSPVKVQDVTEEYLSKHIKESTVTEAAYAKGINRANTQSVVIVYKRFSTKKKAQLVPIGKMWDIANKYFPNSKDLSGFGWDWTGWETDFAYGIIINNKQLPDGFMDELKKEFPDIKLDKNFLIPKTYEETYDCTESNMNEVYDKIWSKGFLECELEEYPAEGKMRISVIYQKDKAKLENEVSKHIKTVTNVQNPTGKEVKKPINESYTERKNFIMKEQITKILEAYNSGVLTQEEASTKIEAIQEQVVTESAVNTTDDLRVKQEKIMESYKMGIINGTEGMRLIERVMMEADYITEEEDTAYEGDDDNEPEDITPEDTDGDTVDSDDTNIDALADYINSLSDDEKTALMSKLSGSDEPTDDDANGNEEVPEDDTAAEGEPTTEETVDPASVSDASLNDANASLDDMEV